MELFRKNIVLLSFVILNISTYYSQLIFDQGVVKGGITAAGFSTGQGLGSGTFDMYIEPGSTIKKAYIFSYRMGYPPSATFIFNGTPYIFDTTQRVMSVNHTNISTLPINLYYKDITNDVNPTLLNNSITIPNQFNLPLNWGYWTFFLYVVYENSTLNNTAYSIIINEQDFIGNQIYSVSNLNSINTTYPVGFSLFIDRITSFPSDKELVYVEGNLLGELNGPDNVNNLWDAGGVKGHFYYQNNQLFGLDDDTPDAIMSGSDGLSDVSSYLTNNSTLLDFQLTHVNYPNQDVSGTNWDLAYFLTYTSPCDTFSVTVPNDTTVCEGTQLQLNASTTNPTATYEWLTSAGSVANPTPGLSCNTCPNPIFTADSSMFYTVRIWNNDSCSVVRPIKINVRPRPAFGVITTTASECGASTGSATLFASPNNGIVDSWQEVGGNNQPSNIFQNLGSGNHTFFFIDTNGCQSADSIVFIDEVNSTVANFTANPLSGAAPLDVSFTNTSLNASNYEWSVNGNNEGNNLSNYTFDPSGTYVVTLVAWQNDPSCADTTYKTIFVYDSLLVEIPNVFTPNGDGVNDFFSINTNMPINCHLVIVNRWGNVMHEFIGDVPASVTNLWDATLANEGVYFYTLRFDASSETPEGVKFLLPAEKEGFVNVER